MYKLICHIVKGALGILLVVLAMSSNVMAQHIQVEQCDTIQFSVVSRPNIDETNFEWAIYNSSPNLTDILDDDTRLDPVAHFTNNGQYLGRSVQVVNLPVGIYYVRIHVWDEITCTDNIEMYVLEVLNPLPDITLYGDSVCVGDPALIKIVLSGVGPYDIKYSYGDEITGTFVNMNGTVTGPEDYITIKPATDGTYDFYIEEITAKCVNYIYERANRPRTGVVIYPKPTNSQIYQQDN